jgi:hypothetical protein
VLARRAFDRCLKPGCLQRRLLGGKGPHHLGRQIRELAEIEGLRHAAILPSLRQNPNKTTLKSAW